MAGRVSLAATDLFTPAQLALTIHWMRELFREQGLPQPPVPENVLNLAPCSLSVTETPGDGGLITGKIKLADPDGAVLYEEEWIIAARDEA
jgi:hypothetical protein